MKKICDYCRVNDICKWVSDMEKTWLEVNKISVDDRNSPISITTNCSCFQKTYKKQDGFFHIEKKTDYVRM